jgi:hypothetical protein
MIIWDSNLQFEFGAKHSSIGLVAYTSFYIV